MIILVVIASLLIISMIAFAASLSVYDLTKIGPISNTIEINRETPDAVLADEMCKGNIGREAYEMFVAEKLDLKLI
jgi:hypothetical protein